MANKEIYRTISKLWLFNYCIVILTVTLQLSYALGTDDTKDGALQNVTAIENDSTSQKPVAEPLIRYRRQPPRTIVKHIIRPKRYKMKIVKRPKIKYSFAEPPPSYYTRKPFIIKKPTFDASLFEDFSHTNVESSDFDLPTSSYETHSMDLDLYKHYEPTIQAASYKEIHKPSSYSYTEPEITYKEPHYTEVSKSPTYTYSVPDVTFKETSKPSVTYSYTVTKQRKPHTEYGVPTEFTYSTGYDKPNDSKYRFEAPASRPVYTEVEKPFYNVHVKHEYSNNKQPPKEVPRIPATTYGVPEHHVSATGSNDYSKYTVVDQKPPYASHAPAKTKNYHFAEPPAPEPSIEITYSPSYEIDIPASHGNSYSNFKSHAPTAAQNPLPEQHQATNYEETSYQEHPKYEDSPQQYDPPANSYESPPQENYEDISPSHQEVSGTNQPSSYQPAPPRHQNIDEYIPASQDLPININHQHPAYDYPKSSYEVPIYDPIPFDASNQQEREIYPPQTYDHANRQPQETANNPSDHRTPNEQSTPNTIQSSHAATTKADVKAPQSPINHLSRKRKRNRNKGSSSTVSTTKHILDAPELEEAFEKENRNKYANSPEPEANESQRFENINHQNDINENYSKGPWNPLKIRTSPTIQMTAVTVSANTPAITKKKRYNYQQITSSTINTNNTNVSTTTTEVPPTKVEIISIEKSRSKTFYNGVVPTPKIFNSNFFRNRFRLENPTTSTTPQPHQIINAANENQFSKRTTKNIFDTTIFKSPINDRNVYRNLPKNHKLI